MVTVLFNIIIVIVNWAKTADNKIIRIRNFKNVSLWTLLDGRSYGGSKGFFLYFFFFKKV